MDEPEILSNLEQLELARTLVMRPRATIEPRRPLSEGGRIALEALQDLSGTLDSRISVIRTLGEGGMGIVHLATQSTLGRHVAVKTLRAGAGNADATLRILREAWVTGALEHPNVVPVYDVGVDATGAPLIVMKRVEGRAWSDVIADPEELRRTFRGADPLEANIRVLIAVCNAIHFAHSRGILHRDIKPENVMIGAFGEVYVLDWGIAVSLRDDPSGRLPPLAQAIEIAGTPSYMAPEMIHGVPSAFSARTDVYLLGAVFYEIFAGAPPHRGETTEAMISSILLSNPSYAENFPAEARRICALAMSADPAARYESVEAFRVAIEDYLAHRGSRKLAFDAKRSLNALLAALSEEPRGEERTLAVFNLLGECRFGYRAALSAWPGNVAAQRGLDRALLAVIEHELNEGDPAAASTLLREMSSAPAEVATRVEAAVRARADEDERLRKLGEDLDPQVGTRTRTFIIAIFGVLWTVLPLGVWCLVSQGLLITHWETIATSMFFLALGLALRWWARETLSKTLLNRRLAMMLGIHLVLQMLVGAGAWLEGFSPRQSTTLHIFTWAFSQSFLAIWLEPWFAISAATSALSFLVASAMPSWLYPLMSLSNLVFTLVVVRIWLPKQDVELFNQRRKDIRRRARRLFLEARGRAGTAPHNEDAG